MTENEADVKKIKITIEYPDSDYRVIISCEGGLHDDVKTWLENEIRNALRAAVIMSEVEFEMANEPERGEGE